MAALEPKIIEVPGIPGKLQEQTLDQYLSALSRDHLAWKQLDEIRAQALKAVELSTQLMQANEKIMELQNKLLLASQPLTYPYPATPQLPYSGFPPNMYIGDPPGTTGTAINAVALLPTPPKPKRGRPFKNPPKPEPPAV